MPSSFDQLGLSPVLLEAIEGLGFTEPTEIQARTIPPALAGKDLAGLSQTGSGKTAAFALPALQSLDLTRAEPQVLILAPTRELAVQICADVHQLGKKLKGLQAVPVYGGAGIDQQIRSLKKGVHLVVGTPGRLLDHLRRKSLKLGTVKMVVLDEADRMLDMGFQDEMDTLLEALPNDRQMLFFSATMNRAVEKLIRRHGNQPETFAIDRKAMTVGTISQHWYEVGHRSKIEVLARLLDRDRPQLAIVFCNTRLRVDEVTESLTAQGFFSDRLHGDLSQQMRERVLGRFRTGNVKILVATDVAARGLDVDDVEMVVNFDLPSDPEDYVHRIGRTGRAGREGCAISFAGGRDLRRIHTIERFIKHEITQAKVPTPEELMVQQRQRLLARIGERLAKNPEPVGADDLEKMHAEGASWKVLAGTLLEILGEREARPSYPIPEDRPSQRGPGKRRDKTWGPGDHRERGPRREEGRSTRSDRPRTPSRRDDERRPSRSDHSSTFTRRDEGERPSRSDRPSAHPRRDEGGKPSRSDWESNKPRREEGERPSRRDRAPTRRDGADEMQPHVINIGRKDGLRPSELVKILHGRGSLPKGTIGKITLYPNYSVVDLSRDKAAQVISSVKASKLKGRQLKMKIHHEDDVPKPVKKPWVKPE